MYVFMPIFEDANIYTLSQYLEARYDSRVSNVFSLLSIVVTIILGLIFAFYFGGRSLSELLGDTPLEMSYTQMVILLAVVTGIYTVTSGSALDFAPAWSPGSDEIVFMRRMGDEADLWITDLGAVGVRPTSWSEVKKLFARQPKPR